MKKRFLAFVISMTLVFVMFGCGNAASSASEASEEPEASEVSEPESEESLIEADDGQNPVMNFIGVYSTDDSKEALVEAEGMENAKIVVTYAPSPWFHDETVMSGVFDPETLTIEFTDATQTEYTYNSDGSVKGQKVLYANGSGKAVFNEKDTTLTITEGENTNVFKWGPSADMKTVTDPDHYAAVTAMDKAEIETVVAFNIRKAYLGENWFALADMIRYPITINGKQLADGYAFVEYMKGKTISESDRKAMNEETLWDMFVNGEGICMGDGEIWLSDPNYMTDKEPVLEIIAINGIEGGEESSSSGAEAPEKEPEGETVIVYANTDLHEITLYKGTEGLWRDREGKEYVRLSNTVFMVRKEGTLLRTYTPTNDYEKNEGLDGEQKTVYDEKTLEEIVIYKGSTGYWYDRSGTEYDHVSDTVYEATNGSRRARTYLPTNDYEDDEKESDDDGAEVNSERDFYDTYSVTIYDENGESYRVYEGTDGNWREENGTTYVQLSHTEFQRKDGNKKLKTAKGRAEAGEEIEEDFYNGYSVVAYDEDGNSHKLYEGSDGNWREEDGTAYVQLSHSEFQRKDGTKRLRVR